MQDTILQSVGWTPLVRLRACHGGSACRSLRQGRVAQPRRQRQGPRRPGHDPRGGAARLAAAGRHHHRGHRRQHRRRPGHGRRRQGLSLHLRPARQDVQREDRCCSRLTAPRWSSRRPTSPPDSPDSYNGVADRLAREIPGAWRPNQFTNLANPEIHYRTTGPEIWEQTEGPDHGLRRGRRHRRHHLRRGPLSEGAQSRSPDHRRRPGGQRAVRAARPGRGRSRASARTSSQDVQQPARR